MTYKKKLGYFDINNFLKVDGTIGSIIDLETNSRDSNYIRRRGEAHQVDSFLSS